MPTLSKLVNKRFAAASRRCRTGTSSATRKDSSIKYRNVITSSDASRCLFHHNIRANITSQSLHVRHRSIAVSMPETMQPRAADSAATDSCVRPFEDIPGPPPLSLFGIVTRSLFAENPQNVASFERDYQMYRDYGPVVKESIGNTFTVVHLFDADDIETIYRNDGKFPKREAFFMLQMYNKRANHCQGLLTSHNEHWAHLRKNVQQKMLRPKAVSAYLSDQSKVGDDLMFRIQELRDENGNVEDLRDTLYNYATECIGVVCFNVRLGALRTHGVNSETKKFIGAVKTVMDISHKEFTKFPFYKWFSTPMFKQMVKAEEIIRAMASKYSEIAVKKKLGEDEISGEEGDLIPYLLSKTELSNDEVHTVISEFIFAGVDTTSHYLAFAIYALARHPEKQAVLAAEIDRVVSDDQNLSSAQIGHLPYLRAVLKETLRVWPVAPGNCRTTTKDLVCSGYKVPKNTFVAMHNDFAQKQEENFKEAYKFVPERWLRGADQEQSHPFASLPFGFGSRSCIGKRFAEQEVSLALIKILKKYRIESDQASLKLVKSVTYTPGEPLKFRFVERS